MGPLLRALGDDTRLEIVERLALAGDATVDELGVDLGLPPASFSRHLKVLLDAGVVRADRRGAWIFYSLDLMVLARLADLIARVVTLRSMSTAAVDEGDG
jgi:DNA-binding transcriptional ArsR family regulator